jgi:hypothetical protein
VLRAELKISDTLTLPLELVTSTQAILARKRSGKSYTASVMAEELLTAHQQIAVIDPTGAWHGLKSSADGQAAGFPVVVFGGEHADVPLDANAGAVLARTLVQRGFSAIFDVSLMGIAEAIRFVTAFIGELFRANREAMHLFIDEADAYAPERPFGEETKSLAAIKRLVKQGGIRGIGVTMITQRPQQLAKSILSQVDILTVLRMSHPLDIKAATDWISSEVSPEFATEVKKALPSLPVGTALICSAPLNIGERVVIRQRTTFNSGATPKPGEKRIQPRVLAKVDLEKLGAEIQATIEKAKADDPAELRRQIAELERQLTAKPALQDRSGEESLLKRLLQVRAKAEAVHHRIDELTEYLIGAFSDLSIAMGGLRAATDTDIPAPKSAEKQVIAPPPVPRPVSPKPASSGPSIGKAERAILTVLAQRGATSKRTIAAYSGYAVNGGAFNNSISKCRVNGWISGTDSLTITEEGRIALGPYEELPTGEALLAHWSGKVGKAEREILNALVAYDGGLDKDTLADRTGYAASGGGFNNAISRLRTLELVEGKGRLMLTPDFKKAVSA